MTHFLHVQIFKLQVLFSELTTKGRPPQADFPKFTGLGVHACLVN